MDSQFKTRLYGPGSGLYGMQSITVSDLQFLCESGKTNRQLYACVRLQNRTHTAYREGERKLHPAIPFVSR